LLTLVLFLWLVPSGVQAQTEVSTTLQTPALSPQGDDSGRNAAGGFGDASPAWIGAPAPQTTAPRVETVVQRTWRDPSTSLERRVLSTRRSALEVGVWDLDAAALALMEGSVGGGSPIERADGAVALAPNLPAAHLARARVLWLHEEAPMDAVRAVVDGLRVVGSNAEASLWFAGSGLYLLALALLAGGLLTLALAAALAAPHAAHDLSHLMPGRPASFAQAALLGAVLLMPLALGEGTLGLALLCLVIGVVYGSRRQRAALSVATLLVLAGLYPVPRLAGALLDAFPGDPVARAAYSTGHGMASPVDIARLEAAVDEDPLALRGLALHARQVGQLGRADGLYQRLLASDPHDVVILNNAANVRLDLGHVGSALALYQRALDVERSPVVLFNLSQAYGRSFQVDDLNRTLEAAQRVDGELIAQLASLQRAKNEGFVVDLPLEVEAAWTRALAGSSGEALAAELRTPLAPGRLGRSALDASVAFAAALLFSWAIGARLRTSRSCGRCGERQCAPCGNGVVRAVCADCTRLFDHPEKTDRALRVQRIEELRERDQRIRRLETLTSVLLPGAAGLISGRPLRGLLGAVCFALAGAAALWRGGIVPDPLVAGAAAPVAFLGVAALAAVLYAASIAMSLGTGEASS
jgi:tetratricopeptide (TPR) repeat protein